MAPKRRSFTLSYHNLISFIPETDNESVTKTRTRVTSPDQHAVPESHGREVRSFYENLLSENTYDDNVSLTYQQTRSQVQPIKQSPNSKCGRLLLKRCRKNSNSTLDVRVQRISPSSSGTAECVSNSNNSSSYITPESGHFNSNQINLKQRQHFKLLQYAQLGDLKHAKDELNDKKKGLDVNFKDFYGWTPLMCAAKEGHVSVVELCLTYGANKSIRNSSGDTALSIARSAGHLGVVSILEGWDDLINADDRKEQHISGHNDSSSDYFHCNVCKSDFSQKEKASHATSTVHLFHAGKCSNVPSYFIPNSNRGFQMLLRSGWNVQSGLGPEGKGRKYPVKTVLKQDRAGIGGEDVKRKKAKVTHFDRGDTQAVNSEKFPTRQISVRKAARNAARSKEKKDRRWEQNLRFEMA